MSESHGEKKEKRRYLSNVDRGVIVAGKHYPATVEFDGDPAIVEEMPDFQNGFILRVEQEKK